MTLDDDEGAPVDELVQQCREAGIRLTTGGDRWDVVLDTPECRNAQLPSTWDALTAVGAAVGRMAPRVVVLSASGPSFSAGLDRRMFTGDVPGEPGLLELAAAPDEELDATIARYQGAFTWWRECDALTISAVQGHAVGAGFQLALAADLMVVADDVQLVMAEPSLGLVPDLAGTGPLVDAVGYPRALEICVSRRAVTAHEAVAWGLAVRSVPADTLPDAVHALVISLMTSPRGAAVATKHLLRGALRNRPGDQLAAERLAQAGRLRDLARLSANG